MASAGWVWSAWGACAPWGPGGMYRARAPRLAACPYIIAVLHPGLVGIVCADRCAPDHGRYRCVIDVNNSLAHTKSQPV